MGQISLQVGEAVYCSFRAEHLQGVFLGYASGNSSRAYVLDVEQLACVTTIPDNPIIVVETVESKDIAPLPGGLVGQFKAAYLEALHSTSETLRRTLESHCAMMGQQYACDPF